MGAAFGRTGALRTIALVALLAVLPGVSKAAPIVDTGPGVGPGFLLNHQQWLAAQFTVGQSTTIAGVSGWIGTVVAGDVRFSLYDGAGNLPGNLLFSAQTFLNQSDPNWQTISDLSWAIASGTYWVAFETSDVVYRGTMPGSAPNQLGNEAHTGVTPGVWFDSNDDGHGIGVMIQDSSAAVPEPSTILLLGVALLGIAVVRRQAPVGKRYRTRSTVRRRATGH